MGTKIKQHVWMATFEKDGRWQDQPQIHLGMIEWDKAVEHAKQQKHATRLSNTAGFDNQGYYFHPSDK